MPSPTTGRQNPHGVGGGLRLLSLDGGGIRGISILLILRALLQRVLVEENRERQARNEPTLTGPLRPCDYFDLIGGTNTGGLIALMLGRLEMGIEEAITQYVGLMEKSFTSSWWRILKSWVWGLERFDSKTLEIELKAMIGSVTGSPDASMVVHEEQQCRVFVCARNSRNLNAGIPTLFRTYHSIEAVNDDCTIWEAARATSAIPGLFRPVAIGRGQDYIEGGLGCNNPARFVLSEAAKLFPGASVALLASIGTGHPKTINLSRWSSIKGALLEMATDCESRHNEMVQYFSNLDNFYYRFSVEQGIQGTAKVESKHRAEVEAHTEVYLLAARTQQLLTEVAGVAFNRVARFPVQYLVSAPEDGRLAHIYVQLQEIQTKLGNTVATHYQLQHQGKQNCHHATRRRVLRGIDEWVRPFGGALDVEYHSGHHRVDSINSMDLYIPSTPSCWTTGIVGVGKTAIAMTVVECLLASRTITAESNAIHQSRTDDSPILCAQYFVNHALDSADLTRLFPTLALQLARISPVAAQLIHAAITTQPSLMTRVDFDQASSLFLDPLCALAKQYASTTVVVVIDGLDEVKPIPGETVPESYLRVTDILGRVADQLPSNSRLLILSRPQTEFLSSIPSHISRLHLDTKQSDDDVRDFFEAELPKIGSNTRNSSFPTQSQLDALCDAAAGHLGWAKQARKWLSSRLRRRVDTNLDELLQGLTRLTHGDLNALYRHILRSLLTLSEGDESFYLSGLRRVLRCLVTLRSPQSIHSICQLISSEDNFDTQICLEDLSGLYADGTQAIDPSTLTQPHKSFSDFLGSPDAPPEFRVDLPQAHADLAVGCLRIMQSDELHFNMGRFSTLHQKSWERVKALSRLSGHVQYACSSFLHHIQHSEELFAEDLERWMTTKFLFWVEVMVLLDTDFGPEESLANDLQGLKASLDPHPGIRALIQHAIDFLDAFHKQAPVIMLRPHYNIPTIYTTTLAFGPSANLLTDGSNLKRISTHSRLSGSYDDTAKSDPCALSPNGEYVAILSRDRLYLFSTASGTLQWPEHDLPMRNSAKLSFSQDGMTLAVVTLGRKSMSIEVYLYDVASGLEMMKFPVCLPVQNEVLWEIWDLQLSPRSKYFLLRLEMSNSWVSVYRVADGNILWSTKSFKITTSRFIDEDRIVLQKDDKEVHVLDTLTGLPIVPPLGKPSYWLTSLAMSPTGSVVLGLLETISILKEGVPGDSESPIQLELTKVADDWIWSASFASDGSYLALGVGDGTIQLWNCSQPTWTHVATLYGHFSDVVALAFRPGGKQLVSYSWDRTIRIWDISPLIDGREFDIQLDKGTLAVGSWFGQYIPVGGWFVGGERPEPFLFKYPFQMPDGVKVLKWNIEG